MNIIVFTSAMVESEFAKYQNEAIFKPNPSNQNFYSKLIKALSFKNNVSVVSHRPFSKGMFEDNYLERRQTSDGSVKYYYTRLEANRSYKVFEEADEVTYMGDKAAQDFPTGNFVVVADCLRVNLAKGALKFARKHGVKIVGMLTDNPLNLSSVKRSYARKVMKTASKFDGFLSLSNGLLRAFRVNSKPHYVFEGLVDETIETKKQPIGNYYFFGGSLYERYGVKTLIHSFIESNIPEKLVIAGSGPLREYIFQNTEKNSRILYLSQLPKEKIYGLEQHSIANINPRPLIKKLDEESVPSKLLEYLASGTPTISTKHPALYEIFKDDVFWIEDDSASGIKRALNSFIIQDQAKMKKRATTARVKVYEIYGVKNQGERISYFLHSISS